MCARDARGVVVTIIADNYFGYCKKETKTQLGMAANLYGQTEVSALLSSFEMFANSLDETDL